MLNMKDKLIRDLNEDIWRKFIAYCKLKNIKVGDELEIILKKHLKKEFSKLLKEK